MSENIKRIREIQLVAAALQQLEPDISFRQADSNVVDFFAELPIDNATFAILAWPSRIIESKEYGSLLRALKTQYNQLDGNPLFIAYYDELKGLFVGSIVKWDYSERIIERKPDFFLLTKDNLARFYDVVREQDHQIRLLRDGYRMIVKTIILNEDRRGLKCNAKMVYLRDLTPQYKMIPKEVKDHLTQFKRDSIGQPQDEYPHDFLDDTILNAVRKVYPDADVNNSLLVANSEYRNLLIYRKYRKDVAVFSILPDLSNIPEDFYPLLGKIEGTSFALDIFMLIRPDKNAFANEVFELKYPVSGWFNSLSKLAQELNTMHRVISLIGSEG